MSVDRQYAPATLRNRDFILDVLRDVLPMTGVILEVASGSGEHIVHFARNFSALVFQPSDPDTDARLSVAAWVKATGVTNVRAPIALDALHFGLANLISRRDHLHQHDPYLAVGGDPRNDQRRRRDTPFQDHRSISMVNTYEKGPQRCQAIKHSKGAFAIATRTGVCETSKRLPRWRNPLDFRLRL